MTTPSSIRIEALVDDTERPAFIAAAEQLSLCLGAAVGEAWPIELNFQAPGAAIGICPARSLFIASLLPETRRMHEPMADVESRWRGYVGTLVALGAPVFVCTVFRHLSEVSRSGPGGASPLLERIRRLNLFSALLSRDTGIGVIDIDRALAHIGGARLGADFALGGVLAAEVAAHTIVWSLLCGGLDEMLPAEVQEQAKAVQGDLQRIDALVNRRLAGRRSADRAHG